MDSRPLRQSCDNGVVGPAMEIEVAVERQYGLNLSSRDQLSFRIGRSQMEDLWDHSPSLGADNSLDWHSDELNASMFVPETRIAARLSYNEELNVWSLLDAPLFEVVQVVGGDEHIALQRVADHPNNCLPQAALEMHAMTLDELDLAMSSCTPSDPREELVRQVNRGWAKIASYSYAALCTVPDDVGPTAKCNVDTDCGTYYLCNEGNCGLPANCETD
jgi:hypothetical protein